MRPFATGPLRYPGYEWLARAKPEKALFKGRAYRFVKRVMDITLVLLSLPVFLPIMGICALIIIAESPGASPFFTQKRTGKSGQPFQMYKFRSMVPNAEAMKAELQNLNELKWPDFKITNDPRITRIGKFMRKTSLDELPQIFNVLKGEMSLVGPRPTSFSVETYQLWQTERLDVLPGLTGLWQILGRASTQFDERLRLDIAYIERRCLWLDIQILFRTIAAVFKQRGAY